MVYWLAGQSFSEAVQDRFLEGKVMNLLVNFLEGCNEGIMGKETEARGSTVKWGETPLEGGGVSGGMCVKIL